MVPSLERNLLSIRMIVSEGYSVEFNKNGGILKLKEKYPIKFTSYGKMYIMKCQHNILIKEGKEEEANYADKEKQSLEMWH